MEARGIGNSLYIDDQIVLFIRISFVPVFYIHVGYHDVSSFRGFHESACTFVSIVLVSFAVAYHVTIAQVHLFV